MAGPRAAAAPLSSADRVARGAERLLRLVGDGRVGAALLLLTGAANAVAALLPDGPRLLASPLYALLLAALALSGVAAVAVRAPAAWREWRRPAAVQSGTGTLRAIVVPAEGEAVTSDAVAAGLAAGGYRVRIEARRRGWAVHGVRRGWSRFAGLGSHLAVVVVVLGAAIGAAFGSETTFSLLPGEQALLDQPRPGFTAAVRLERLDARFGPGNRPTRLDTEVTFLRDGAAVVSRTLRVNEPADFAGYLVHPWTYGPAARLSVEALDGRVLLAGAVPLDEVRDGAPAGSAELPVTGVTLGLALADADANELGVSVVGAGGLVDGARLRPGQQQRVGDVVVRLEGFDAWVTFLSRRDPGLLLLFGGAALLCASVAVAFWLPRRRVTVRQAGDALELVLRGERFDRPADELTRLAGRLGRIRS